MVREERKKMCFGLLNHVTMYSGTENVGYDWTFTSK